VREGGEEGGLGGYLTLKCNATRSGAARTSAAPLGVAPHSLASPPPLALQRLVSRHRHWRGQKGLFP
jgi:hypothetical protein